MAYIASIHPASATRYATKLNFFSPDESALALAKANRAEIHTFSPSGLSLQTSFTVYGNITGLLSLRPANSPTDHLFITTAQNDYFTVSWDPERGAVRNERVAQDISDRFLRDAPAGPRYIADPGGRMLGVHVYEGLFLALPIVMEEKKGKGRRKTIPPETIGDLGEPSPIRMKELMVVDMVFLHRTDVPVLAVLHRDGKPNFAQLATYQVVKSGGVCELQEWEIQSSNLEAEAKMLIPLPEPLGGLLVLGEQTVTYLPPPDDDAQALKRPLVDPTTFRTWGAVDRQRYLLGDEFGKLKMLFLELDEEDKVSNIMVETIGQTSPANTLVYLENGHAFVGSQQGDSQLIKLSPKDPKCSVVQTFPSLAPIFDFQIIGGSSTDEQQSQYSSGQTRIVAGCGGFSNGVLRSIRSGVGLKDSAILGELEGARGLFALKSSPSSQFDDTLVLSFIEETRIFKFDADGEAEELDQFVGLQLEQETLLAMNLPGERVLQVTPSRIQLIDIEGGTLISDLAPESKIISVSASQSYLLCNIGNKSLVAYSLQQELKETGRRTFEHEIACLYTSSDFPDVCAVGFWTVASVSLLSVPGLQPLAEESLAAASSGTIPRSVVLAQILPNQPPTFLVAMGDGTLYTFSANPQKNYALSHKKAISLDTQAFDLSIIPSTNTTTVSVFAACDHPSLIYSDQGRLLYSAVTAENVTNLTPFNASAFPSSVAILANNELKISTVDTARNVHFKTLNIGDVVRRVTYSKERQILGIVTINSTLDISTGEERYTSFVCAVDDAEFTVFDKYQLSDGELVESIICAPLSNGDGTYSEKFLVGTGLQPGPDETDEIADSKEGRILIFELSEDRKLKLAAEKTVKGAVKSLDTIDTLIIAALNKTVDLYTLTYPTPTRPELTHISSYRCHSEPLDLSITPPHIAVADLMKGPYLLSLTPPHTIIETARTYQTIWTTSLSLLSPSTILSADAEGNLSLWHHDSTLLIADQKRLQLLSDLNLGQMVNRIRRIPSSTVSSPLKPQAYIGTVEGGLFLVSTIDEGYTELLLQLQTNLAKVVRSLGGLGFNRFRAYCSPTRVGEEPYRFVDGDFVEEFLGLGEEEAEMVVQGEGGYGLNRTVEEVRGIVEGLRRFR